jgi:hypothetical protein
MSRDFIVNWRYGTIGPVWFRRSLWAWRWFWSGEPFPLSQSDIKHLFATLAKKDEALRDLERGCRNAGLGYKFIYEYIDRGLHV